MTFSDNTITFCFEAEPAIFRCKTKLLKQLFLMKQKKISLNGSLLENKNLTQISVISVICTISNIDEINETIILFENKKLYEQAKDEQML